MGAKAFNLPEDHEAGRPWEGVTVDDEREDLNERGTRRGAHQRRQQALRSADMARISAMLLQGLTPEEMAQELGLALNTIKQDLMHLNRLWVRQISENSEQYRAVFIAKLMRLEGLALEGFQDSKIKTITDNGSGGKNGPSSNTREIESAGDPAFLNCARECIKSQIVVLGLDGKEQSVKGFDKEAFLDTVAEKIAEAKMAATATPITAEEIAPITGDSPFG